MRRERGQASLRRGTLDVIVEVPRCRTVAQDDRGLIGVSICAACIFGRCGFVPSVSADFDVSGGVANASRAPHLLPAIEVRGRFAGGRNLAFREDAAAL